MPYDSAPEIMARYSRRRSFIYSLQSNADKVYKGREIFIFSDDIVIPSNSSRAFVDDTLGHVRISR